MAYNFPENENKILKFWEDNKIFEKLRKKNEGKKRWSFLDGPITANNPMGVHHAWGRTYKDLFQRYKAMQGFDERYQNGFDCQGLWVEVEVEKELGFKNKKDIEAYGVDKFVEKCKERVKKYSAIQTAQSIRLGQWMDWENSYYTMSDENNYAIWHFLKKCWEDGYLYKGRDSVPWCPRCGTAISQHEILTEEYKETIHKAIYFKLPITVGKLKGKKFLVWTTTPWTIPANVALVVNPEFEYGIYKKRSIGGGRPEELILLKSLAKKILGKDFILAQKIKGKDLKGIKYEGPFDNLPRVKKIAEEKPKTFHTVVLDKDLVTEVEGTGIVHCAPGAGEEDFKIGQKESLAVIDVIDETAVYLDGMEEFSGKNAKQNPEIIFDYLKTYKNGDFFFKEEDYTHRYPTCWRCKTELVWRVVDEWYISMDRIRKNLQRITKKINWIPSFGKERELDWLKNMHDWLISKKRYWGLALPIFECECGNFEVIGSKEELKKRAVEGWDSFNENSPHRPWVDNVKIRCKKCKKTVSRIKDVGNPWLDAGIVPFSTIKYFEDKNYWKKWFPLELVCESFPGQFKNWFYSLLVMSAVLENSAPMKTIFGFASVKDERGEDMHKSKGNAIWLDEAAEKVGADPMRWLYLRQNPADNLLFGYKTVEEIKRKLLTLLNVYTFLNTYVDKKDFPKTDIAKPKNILDKWILSKIDHLIVTSKFNLDKYDAAKTVLAIEDFFINDLSLWYVRRSRKRFHETSSDRNEAIAVLYYVLLNLTKMVAPIMPFFAEEMYLNLRNSEMSESVHLCEWPEIKGEGHTDLELEEKMDEVRTIVNSALAERSAKAIKIRQPLASLKIRSAKSEILNYEELLELIKEEVNVKEIIFDAKIENKVELDTNITEKLKEEGTVRDIIRQVQEKRKEMGLVPQDKISVQFLVPKKEKLIIEKNRSLLLKEFRATEIFTEERDGGIEIKIKKV
ncbi:MAG: isoleucine--tRNA ligase [Patescibacteria group bacterium]